MDALVQKKMENSLLFELCSFYRNGGMFTNAIKLFPAFNPVDRGGGKRNLRSIVVYPAIILCRRLSYFHDIRSYFAERVELSRDKLQSHWAIHLREGDAYQYSQ